MPSEIRLTPTSYIVLGLIDAAGESTPYELKQMVAATLGNFWTIQHAQLYSEPQRLARGGYLSERKETSGRRRKHYEITDLGREGLRAWLAEPTPEPTRGRVPSMLKVALGADPKPLAENQLPARQATLKTFEEVKAMLDHQQNAPKTLRQLVDVGVEQQREMVRYWEDLADLDQP
jgi:PadR family transcriptional regulator, regulatory protein AphA